MSNIQEKNEINETNGKTYITESDISKLSPSGINYLRFVKGDTIRNITGSSYSKNVTFDDIMNYDDQMLEDDHAFIQWLFPTFRPSQFNQNAPVLEMSDILILMNDYDVIDCITKAKNKMIKYWGLVPFNRKRVELLNGHNGLRLSRFIECCGLFLIDIVYIMSVIDFSIKHCNIFPYCENYEGINRPLWYIRYFETKKMMSNLV